MKVGAIIQARMSSKRLPGKVLRQMASRPMLDYLLERVMACRELDGVVVATSVHPSDQAIADHCRAMGVTCVRGPLDDVAARFMQAVSAMGWDAFVRISGDSPLLDPSLVSRAVRLFQRGEADLVSNVVKRTFPKGQSVEVLSRHAFAEALPRMRAAEEREHVTVSFYRDGCKFKKLSFEADNDCGEVQLSVDTEEDFELIEKTLKAMDRHHLDYGWQEIIELRGKIMAERDGIA